jgi:hypothetical protein
MLAAKWFVIAKNEYRIRTSSIREIRPYFPYLVVGVLVVYVLFIAPTIVGLFLDELVSFLLSQVAVALVQVILFMFFFLFITFPISSALKDIKIEQQGIFLSAPIKSSDVLLGEFLGELPLYAIIIILVTGFFTAILKPIGLNMLQIAMIIIIFVTTLSSALWIGTVIAALLRTKLGKSARGKDIGKALSFIVVLPIIAVMYAILGGGVLEALADPGTSGAVEAILGLLPSSWGADIIIGFVSNPGSIRAVGLETVTHFGGLIIFFVTALWIGTRIADRAYSLETTTFTAAKVKPDSTFYRILQYLVGGGSFGTLFVSVFKIYSRRLQNLSYIVYIVGIVAMANIFLYRPEEPVWALEQGAIFFPMLAAFVASDITLRGKETLFVYRKTPSGEGRFVKAMLLKGWIVAVPIAGAIIAVTTMLVPHVSLISVLINIGFVIVLVAANVAFASGLFLLMPVQSEKREELMMNVMVVMVVSMVFFMVCLPLLKEIILLPILHWLSGIVFLYLGKRNLGRIE